MATVYASANRNVARMREVRQATHDQTQVLASRARTILAGHRTTGQAKITVTRGKVDSFVNLEDPAATALEYGRPAGTAPSGRSYTAREGLYILHRTMGWR